MKVLSCSTPQAMMSFAFSNAKSWAWSIVSGLPSFWNRNFSSSVIDDRHKGTKSVRDERKVDESEDEPVSWMTRGTLNTCCNQLDGAGVDRRAWSARTRWL